MSKRLRLESLKCTLRKVLLPARVPGTEIPEVDDLDGFKTILEDSVQTWTEQWRQEGFEQGRLAGRKEGRKEGLLTGQEKGLREGELAVLMRQLERKFGSPKPAIRRRIETADADQLLKWADRLLTAERLSDVFKS